MKNDMLRIGEADENRCRGCFAAVVGSQQYRCSQAFAVTADKRQFRFRLDVAWQECSEIARRNLQDTGGIVAFPARFIR